MTHRGEAPGAVEGNPRTNQPETPNDTPLFLVFREGAAAPPAKLPPERDDGAEGMNWRGPRGDIHGLRSAVSGRTDVALTMIRTDGVTHW